ncbi:Mss4-like protein [Rhexocercosporidium sp. MPI-PUGE-AT-0058]|nr:Mss4-like protein [Rhexocercosporidium sp. MPI-PUGE-AT-0058]
MSSTTTDSPETIYGACNCGRIVVSLPRTSLPSSVTLCHCSNCRASSGSLFAVNMLTSMADIKIEGTPKIHVDIAASGNSVNRHFCGDCGSAIMSVVTVRPEKSFLKGGLFVKSGVSLPAPGREQFWRRSERWEVAHPGLVPID